MENNVVLSIGNVVAATAPSCRIELCRHTTRVAENEFEIGAATHVRVMVGQGSVLVQQAWVGKAGGRTVSIGHTVDLLLRCRWFLQANRTYTSSSVLSTTLHSSPLALTRTEIFLFNQSCNTRQHLCIQESAGGGRWSCLNTCGGKWRRNVVVLRSAPAATSSRQLMSASRSSRSAESSSLLP